MRSKNNILRILVLGYIVRGPMGGMTWHHLQYLVGLHQLGHDVYFLEDSGDTIYSCYDPIRNVTDQNPAYGLSYAKKVFEQFELGNRWAYYDHHQQQWHGPVADSIFKIVKDADLLINLSCSNSLRPWLQDIPIKMLIDTDPLFTQIRNLADEGRMKFCQEHNVFFTYGENFRQDGCLIPDDGFEWQPTRQPVVLSAWPLSSGDKTAAFTTVMKWESYPGKIYNGRYFGMKSESFIPYISLPSHAKSVMELAVSDSSTPKDTLKANGWHLTSPQKISGDPWQYQQYIQHSKAEFSVAKHGYVEGRTGWFSERSAGYLASGRPVVVQETGFSDWLKTDFGVIPFDTMDEAIAAIEEVNNNYKQHCNGAKEVAVTYFAADRVLTGIIEKVFQKSFISC